MEIKQLLEKTQRGNSVSRDLVNRWQGHFQKIPRPTKLKNDWKTQCNHRKFDVERVEFTQRWRLPDYEG